MLFLLYILNIQSFIQFQFNSGVTPGLLPHLHDITRVVFLTGQKLQMEKSAERAHFEREQKYELQNQKREHKREMDSLTRRFANHQADIEKLNAAEKEVEVRNV